LSGATTVGTSGAANLILAVTGGSSYTLAIAATDTAASIVTNFNAISGLGSAGAVTAGTDSTGHLQLTANPTSTFTITASAATAAVGLTADSSTNFTATSTANSSRTTLQSNFNSLLTQIDQLAGDSSYNGVNLLSGTNNNLKVVFNETSTSSLTISGVNFNSAGLGLSALSGTGATGFQTDAEITSTISAINAALTTVRTQAVTFGTNSSTIQTRSDFTKNLINTLQTGSDSLVLADQNQESANLLTLQTRQQLSISALSISNQAQQAVLKLFP
jgi:flagellin